MIARLVVANCLPTFFLTSTFLSTWMLRVEPRPAKSKLDAWRNRRGRRFQPFLLGACAAGCVLGVIFVINPHVLVSTFERTVSLMLASALFVVWLVMLVASLRAPKIAWEDYRKTRRRKLLVADLVLSILILGIGAVALKVGRDAGLRALDAACTEAREVTARPTSDAARQAGERWSAVFLKLVEDKELDFLQERTYESQRAQSSLRADWPTGQELTALVAARRDRLADVECLAAGPAPEFMPNAYGKDMTPPLPPYPITPGLRQAELLLDLAMREAAERGDPARAVGLLRTKFALGELVSPLPNRLGGLGRGTPGNTTMGMVLTVATAGERGGLEAYARALRERRRTVPQRHAKLVMDEGAALLLWMQRVTKEPANADEKPLGTWLPWSEMALHGSDEFPAKLPRSRELGRILELPFEQARAAVRSFDQRIQSTRPASARLLNLLDAFVLGAEKALARQARVEQRLAAFEVACVLRLRALETGAYPESLDALAPKDIEADLLRPTGPVRLGYEREAGGCRLRWRDWQANTRTTVDGQPVGEPLVLSDREEVLTIGKVKASGKPASASQAEGR